jgi:phosphoglucosamine mutase
MISASHNPFEDNGIKLFGPDGYKLSDEIEREIEARLARERLQAAGASAELGRAKRIDDAPAATSSSSRRRFPKGLSLAGLKIVIDCANGAAYKVAPTVLGSWGRGDLRRRRARRHQHQPRLRRHASERMQALVRERGADLGIALDGDADRVIVVDERGRWSTATS